METTNNEKIQCSICHQMFHNKSNLKRHELNIHNEDEFSNYHICDVCNKSFKDEGHLKVHKRTIHEPPKYRCDICEKDFTTLGYLKSHYLLHDETTRFVRCHVCAKKLSPFRIKIHIKILHSNEERVQYPCNYCGKHFLSRNALNMHAQSIHHGIRLPCDLCNQQFSNYQTLNNH